ncbi:MAG: response regulator [Verrucomicrobiota bacterium]
MQTVEKSFGILFVDDEEKARKYFLRLFEKQYPVYTAGSVSEAKTILDERHQEIGVLVTDQRMPEDKGVELLKYARKTYPEITRMLTTAYSDLSDAIDSVNSGEILRYISKPWDIRNLNTEINQGMTFFSLRNERDLLMREKLSARQRLKSVNRIRSLVATASGLTNVCNPIAAVRSIIEQLPHSQETQNGNSSEGPWAELREDLESSCKLADHLREENGIDNRDFTTVFTNELIGELANDIDLSYSPLPDLQLEGHKPSLIRMLASLANWLKIENEPVKVECQSRESGITLSFSAGREDWAETSISSIPGELARAVFLCNHHGGTLNIRPGQPFVVETSLPFTQKPSEESARDLDWLENVLKRFENW